MRVSTVFVVTAFMRSPFNKDPMNRVTTNAQPDSPSVPT